MVKFRVDIYEFFSIIEQVHEREPTARQSLQDIAKELFSESKMAYEIDMMLLKKYHNLNSYWANEDDFELYFTEEDGIQFKLIYGEFIYEGEADDRTSG